MEVNMAIKYQTKNVKPSAKPRPKNEVRKPVKPGKK
jgi:hypothetical protein